ncbi:hypothetical protein [Sorangium sp. So ce1078]|uniref:hypothetical protein n=1 Tax=Sorangium sp. So ce1078 TaxID=3133329 RepID=UPI003F629E65
MRRLLFSLPWAALAILVCAGSAAASEWHTVEPDPPAAALSARGAADARGAAETYLKRAASELRLLGVSLRYRNEIPVGEHRTVRFSQVHAGLPVLGAAAAVHVTPENRARVVVLDVARDLSVPTAPKLAEEAALDAVEASFGMTLAERPSAALAVLPGGDAGGKLVWVVDVPSARGGDRHLVDAHTGKLVHRRPLAVNVLGRVYPINPVVTPDVRDLELTDLDVAEPQTLSGWNGNLRVVNYVDGSVVSDAPILEQTVVPNARQDFLYDPPARARDAKDEFAQVNLYYHLTRMRDYFTSVHQLDMGAPGWKLVAIANMLDSGRPFDNAYFSLLGAGEPFSAPSRLGFGQGTDVDFSDDSDVILHEFTHYVEANAIGFSDGQFGMDDHGFSPWAGSIGEGTADYFASTVNDDPSMGEASLVHIGTQRDLSDDSKVCPDDLTGKIHDDGELIGSLAWSLREQLGKDRSDRLVWGAMTLLTLNASLGDFARGLRATADSLVSVGVLTTEDAAAVDALIERRGLDDCDVVLDLSGGRSRRTRLLAIESLPMGLGLPCGGGISLHSFFHFKSTPPAGAKGIRFNVDLVGPGGDDLMWNIHVRTGKHVAFAGFPPLPTEYDYSVEGMTENQGEVVIDETSDPPFDPTQTYYMVIVHANCQDAIALVSSTELTMDSPAAEEPPVPTEPEPGSSGGAAPAPGNPSEDPPAPGCACRAAGPSAPVSAWAALSGLALAGAAALRRRARTGRDHRPSDALRAR